MQVQSDASELQEPCPGCGKPRAEWIDGDGTGYEVAGLVFCSEDCAQRNPEVIHRRAS